MNNMEPMVFKAEVKGQRLDVFVVEHCPELSRSHVQKLIEQGNVLVDGSVRKANYKLRGGEAVQVTVPQAEALQKAVSEHQAVPYEAKELAEDDKQEG